MNTDPHLNAETFSWQPNAKLLFLVLLMMPLLISLGYWQLDRAQEKREKKHKSKFKYDLKYYAITPTEIETELDEFYQHYAWPRPSQLVTQIEDSKS